jgi:hypothetical protein
LNHHVQPLSRTLALKVGSLVATIAPTAKTTGRIRTEIDVMSRPVSLRDIDPSMLGPHSPLLELMRRKPRSDREHQEQVKVFAWAHDHETEYPDLRWLFAVPNWIGVRTVKQGARLKAEGRKAGVLDMWLPVRRAIYPGLAIELKVQGNRPSAEQQDWIKHLIREGWRVVVAYGSEKAISELEAYLK